MAHRFIAMACWLTAEALNGQQPAAGPETKGSNHPAEESRLYTLGNDDQITVRALHVDEIPPTPIRIGADGNIRLPMAGLIHASGLTVGGLEEAIASRLRAYVVSPEVTVSVMEFRSEPVSVLGAVKNPGVYQLAGQKSIAEMLSMAGGLDPAAGPVVKITREAAWGPVPIPDAAADSSGRFSVAEISIASILKADNPKNNIAIRPRDVISVPRAEMVYVVGQVQRAGGFVLTDGKGISLLQALSLAGGMDKTASPKHAVLLRPSEGGAQRKEVPVDLRKVLSGQAADISMNPGDILFVPNNAPKQALLRGAEAAIQLGTGVVIWRR